MLNLKMFLNRIGTPHTIASKHTHIEQDMETEFKWLERNI